MTTAEMTAEMTVDQIGDWLIAEAQDAALTRLAAIALRRLRADAAALLSQAIGRLAVPRRMADEAERIAAMLERATPPGALAAAPVAPARGPMRIIDNVTVSRGGILHRDGTQHGRRLDQLSLMCRKAWEQHQGRGTDAPFVAPFTMGQIGMGLHYQALAERHDAAGIRCASAEVRAVSGAGGGGDFITAYIAEGRELDHLRARIGHSVALAVRRGSAARRDVTDLMLVDMVCRDGHDLTHVLRRHGWANDARPRRQLRTALAAALDRMQGHPQKGA